MNHLIIAVACFLVGSDFVGDFVHQASQNSGAHGGEALSERVGDGVDELLDVAVRVDCGEELLVVVGLEHEVGPRVRQVDLLHHLHQTVRRIERHVQRVVARAV